MLDEILGHRDQPRAGARATPSDAAGAEHARTRVGPYELQDFHLYYIAALRLRADQGRVPGLDRLARRERGAPGPTAPDVAAQRSTTLAEIKTHLRHLPADRFFKTSQFKRSCVPNAPKVGSGGSLSPRGDWRAPSDSEATVWLDELETVPDA